MSVGEINHAITMTGGAEALASAGLLFTIAFALSPDMKAFPCLPPWIRYIAVFCSFGYAWRGVTMWTAAEQPLAIDNEHIHADIVTSWGFHTLLMAAVLVYVLSQKLNPEVRARLMRHWHRDQLRARKALAVGGESLAVIMASSTMDGIDPTLPREPLPLPANVIEKLEALA